MTEEDFAAWLVNATAGEQLVYATATYLTNREQVSIAVARVARKALEAYGHGQIELVQKALGRADDAGRRRFQYIAIKRDVIRKPVPFALPTIAPGLTTPTLELAA